MKLRRLKDAGIHQFSHYLTRLGEAPVESIPSELLENPSYSEEACTATDIENPGFATRYDLGLYLADRLQGCDQNAISSDAGLWTWLALFYFADLCPADISGSRKPSATNNYVLSDRHKDFHRHAIRTTYMLVREHGETVRFLLSNPLAKRGELTEQITGRPYFLSCDGIMEAARLLYADPNKGTWKRGAASKRAGAARRFGLVVKQFELTYDMFSLTGEQIVALLPREFDGFRPQTA